MLKFLSYSVPIHIRPVSIHLPRESMGLEHIVREQTRGVWLNLSLNKIEGDADLVSTNLARRMPKVARVYLCCTEMIFDVSHKNIAPLSHVHCVPRQRHIFDIFKSLAAFYSLSLLLMINLSLIIVYKHNYSL